MYALKNLNFSYPNSNTLALKNINLDINQGEFVLLCGKSGCGKTTLLRMLKSCLTPFGEKNGEILYNNANLNTVDLKVQAEKIGFVLQNPDTQIVTDKVWHEMAFGLESLGLKTDEIRTRVSEMASFFGIQNWFYNSTSNLSGGQKQLLNLASVMVMEPEVLILDEPTSQLDPVSASEFLNTIKKINDELGTTVIITEHRLEDVFAMAHRVVVMDEGTIIADGAPKDVCAELINNNSMCLALPVSARVFAGLKDAEDMPLTVGEGKVKLEKYSKTHTIDKNAIINNTQIQNSDPCIQIKDAFFRYEKYMHDAVKNLNLTVYKGEFFAILGGNGTGKTTAVSLMAGLNTPYRGRVYINGCDISKIKDIHKQVGVLPQDPKTLFVHKTVYMDLMDVTDGSLSQMERHSDVCNVASLCSIDTVINQHPYDLSGGEQQRVALAMVLLQNPKILIMDEPTKGMDAHFKQVFADILNNLKASGVTIVMVSHDIEFCACYADRCGLFFDGGITSLNTTRSFFGGNRFYTTSANRMSRKLMDGAITAQDIILAFGGKIADKQSTPPPKKVDLTPMENIAKPKFSPKQIITGIFFAVCFVTVLILKQTVFKTGMDNIVMQSLSVVFASLCIIVFFPQKELKTYTIKKHRKKSTIKTFAVFLLILVAIPFTIYFGTHFLHGKKYYLISLLIITETLIAFATVFEKRKPKAREIVIISVLCAITVAGRTAFFMLPEFKPVIALVIIAGICFGGETGFLVGSITGVVSNFVFGQGPWTPWQMFSFGIIGFFAGIIFKVLPKTRISLSVFGFLSALVIYGGIMNSASVLMVTDTPVFNMFKSAYLLGLPVDLVHAMSSAFFLWFISEPMIEKLERVKIKYGLI